MTPAAVTATTALGRHLFALDRSSDIDARVTELTRYDPYRWVFNTNRHSATLQRVDPSGHVCEIDAGELGYGPVFVDLT